MKVRGGGGGGVGGSAYSRGALICYFGRECGRLFGGGRLLERGRLFEEIRYLEKPLTRVSQVHH